MVKIPVAASAQPCSDKLATASGIAGKSASIGRSSPITPVEKGSTCVALTPVAAAKVSQLCRASLRPCCPVPALALPVLVKKYCGLVLARCCLDKITGAAQKEFCVNNPATVLPATISITTKSGRPAVFIPALVVPSLKPDTACIVGNCPLPVAITEFFHDIVYIFYPTHKDKHHYVPLLGQCAGSAADRLQTLT